MRQILYSDRFVKLYKDEIVILSYFFPTFTNKSVKPKHVKILYFEQQGSLGDLGKTKDWGMSLTPIWWACDFRRHIHIFQDRVHFNVVIDNGSSVRKGFSVCDIKAFLEALLPLIPQAKIVQNIPGVGDWGDQYLVRKQHQQALKNQAAAMQSMQPVPQLQAAPLPSKEPIIFENGAGNRASAPPVEMEEVPAGTIAYPKLE